jgi:hypothetical protein
MKTAKEEYKSALQEAGQSTLLLLDIGDVAKQRVSRTGLNDTSHRSGPGEGGQGVVGPDVSRLVFQQYYPLRLGRAALSWIEQLWSTQSVDYIGIAPGWTASRRGRVESRSDLSIAGFVVSRSCRNARPPIQSKHLDTLLHIPTDLPTGAKAPIVASY